MVILMQKRGFTIVELITIIAVIAVLSSTAIVVYNGAQERTASATTQKAVRDARSTLELYNGINRDYPPNLAGVDYAAPQDMSIVLYTNAPQLRVHSNLTNDQNAQLLLNACNANMPVSIGGSTYNTTCAFAGVNFHIKGKQSSNVVLGGPEILENEFVLTCGPTCDTVAQTIKDQFVAQGGTFPVYVSGNQVIMPEPELTSYGKATRYCIEGRYAAYDDIIYHMQTDDVTVQEDACPSDPELHYP